jgi:hypothetical protein
VIGWDICRTFDIGAVELYAPTPRKLCNACWVSLIEEKTGFEDVELASSD